MKALTIAIITALIFPLQVLAIGRDSMAKQHFYVAKQHIENMLSGKVRLSYEDAIFEIENAWYSGEMDCLSFDEALDFHANNVLELIRLYIDSTRLNPQDDLLKTRLQKIEEYTNALVNFVIFQYITGPTILERDDKVIFVDPFQYSYQDPLATANWENTLLSHFLNTGTGNCFAFASFFKVLSDRFKSKALLGTAPGHIFISHADDKGTLYNVELAGRSFPGTGTLETLTYTTDEAVKSGIALRKLTAIQSVALCLVYLAKGYEHKFGVEDDDFMLSCAETALNYDTLNLNAMLLKSEILEARLIKQHRPFEMLRQQADFGVYENLIDRIFSLGYREMPFEMKNLLIKGWTRDSIAVLTTKDQVPDRLKHRSLRDTKYASLSWGLFDEEIKTKAVEQYGKTIFNTNSRRITGFILRDEILYNSYVFDPVVFAWNVDPLAYKYPGISPYAFCYDNPINVVDPDGREGIVVSGQPGDHSNKEHFLVNGLNRARIIAKKFKEEKSDEKVTWLIYNSGNEGGYDKRTLDKYQKLGEKYGIAIQVVSDADQIVEYVNEKNGGRSRADDKVSNFYYIGHATPGDLDVGFTDHSLWTMLTNDKVEPSDFERAAFAGGCTINVVGGCRTAVDGDRVGEKSVINQFADKVDKKSTIKGSNVRVYYGGDVRTDEQLVEHNKGEVITINGKR